jgi:perosamine synthetase
MQDIKAKLENYFRQGKSALELQYKSLPPRKEVLDKTLGKEVRPRKSLDITPAQLAFALKECTIARETERTDVQKLLVQAFYRNASNTTVQSPLTFGLCVRTIYEATLKALNLPKESIVVMSAVTIQDMVVITEAQGLKVVAADLDLESLIPDAGELDRIATKFAGRVKVFVLAHLFGARTDVSKLIAVCKKHNILFVEDCAESWVSDHLVYTGSTNDNSGWTRRLSRE